MRWILYTGLLFCLFSCGSRIYSYKFSMKESDTADRLYYENDTLSLKFKFYLKGLMISFSNKSGVPVKIHWDQLKVTENGTDKKIEHIKIMDEKCSVYKPPSVFSPGAVHNDFVVYASNIYYQNELGTEQLKIKDMYLIKGRNQDRKSILNLKGQRIVLHFPVEINNVSHAWVFNFLLHDITSKKDPNSFSAGDVFEIILTPLLSF